MLLLGFNVVLLAFQEGLMQAKLIQVFVLIGIMCDCLHLPTLVSESCLYEIMVCFIYLLNSISFFISFIYVSSIQ